mmetsp:Transcript_8875/g.17391  ORF Transcript_8875/g.17391 Transcript_8875/m.17391 type:complete len:426 (-) Transcript_8875:152-1429(-)
MSRSPSEESTASWDPKRLPAAMNGFALGMAGLAAVLLNLGDLPSSRGFAKELFSCPAGFCVIVAIVEQFLFFVKLVACSRKKRCQMLETAKGLAGQTWHTTIPLITTTSHRLWGGSAASVIVAQVIVHMGAVAQLVVGFAFLRRAFKDGLSPEPVWFPALVTVGQAAMSGSTLRIHPGIVAASVWTGIVVCVILIPWVTYRVSVSSKVAPSATVALVSAPASFMTVSIIAARMSDAKPLVGPKAIVHAFLATELLSLLITSLLIIPRFPRLRDDFFSFSFGTVTFPAASTANATICYVAGVWPNPVLETVAVCIAVVTIVTVLGLNVAMAVALSRDLSAKPDITVDIEVGSVECEAAQVQTIRPTNTNATARSNAQGKEEKARIPRRAASSVSTNARDDRQFVNGNGGTEGRISASLDLSSVSKL